MSELIELRAFSSDNAPPNARKNIGFRYFICCFANAAIIFNYFAVFLRRFFARSPQSLLIVG
jgi:hypothetical protein